jgi:NAD(P)-dependent dehydrogenase (short-subunit alcohol dehydrogenase family)
MSTRVVVTGANSGIGFAAAREFARRGNTVTLAVRDLDRGDQAAARIHREVPDAEVEVMRLDLASLDSIRKFAAVYRESGAGPDLLVNNAGVMALPRRVSADGHELHLATNHLGHFALTGLLLGGMLERSEARVVTVASLMHRLGRIPFDDLNAERRYSKWLTYSNTKLANLMFMFELQRRADAARVSLRSVAAHPGYSSTGLVFAGPQMSGSRLKHEGYALLNRMVGQNAQDGARPTVFAATADLPGGSYVGPSGPFEVRGAPKLVQATRRAQDASTARRLWEISEQITGIRFDFDAPTTATADLLRTSTQGALR